MTSASTSDTTSSSTSVDGPSDAPHRARVEPAPDDHVRSADHQSASVATATAREGGIIEALALPAFLRWWWVLALGGGLVLGIVQLLFTKYLPDPFLSKRLSIQIAAIAGWIVLLILWLGLIGWTFVVAPVMSARDRTPTFRVPPAWHLNTLQWIVTAPAFMLAITGIYDTFDRTIEQYLRSGALVFYRMPDWAWFYPPLVLAAAIYAWSMHGWLRRHLMRTTRDRGVCFDCGYDLRSQAEIMLEQRDHETPPDKEPRLPPSPAELHVRCPECGAETRLPISVVVAAATP